MPAVASPPWIPADSLPPPIALADRWMVLPAFAVPTVMAPPPPVPTRMFEAVTLSPLPKLPWRSVEMNRSPSISTVPLAVSVVSQTSPSELTVRSLSKSSAPKPCKWVKPVDLLVTEFVKCESKTLMLASAPVSAPPDWAELINPDETSCPAESTTAPLASIAAEPASVKPRLAPLPMTMVISWFLGTATR